MTLTQWHMSWSWKTATNISAGQTRDCEAQINVLISLLISKSYAPPEQIMTIQLTVCSKIFLKSSLSCLIIMFFGYSSGGRIIRRLLVWSQTPFTLHILDLRIALNLCLWCINVHVCLFLSVCLCQPWMNASVSCWGTFSFTINTVSLCPKSINQSLFI